MLKLLLKKYTGKIGMNSIPDRKGRSELRVNGYIAKSRYFSGSIADKIGGCVKDGIIFIPQPGLMDRSKKSVAKGLGHYIDNTVFN